jgi:hypothetical protein
MEYKTRQELNELSLKAFGASSRWQKFVNRGVPQLYERDREVVLADQMGKLGKKVFTDQKVVIHRFTVEEVKKHMMQILEDRHTREKLQKEIAEQQALEATQKDLEAASKDSAGQKLIVDPTTFTALQELAKK